jgi:phosphotriesterase-related protein
VTVLVQSVLGPVPVESLGPTVTHEHVFLDSRDGYQPRPDLITPDLVVTRETKLLVDRHPLAVLDNLLLDDLPMAVEELRFARAAGVGTLVEATSLYTGRRPELLVEASRQSGVTVIMGSGLYLDRAIPHDVRQMSEAELFDLIDTDFRDGESTPHGVVQPGVVGEVGVSADPTDV